MARIGVIGDIFAPISQGATGTLKKTGLRGVVARRPAAELRRDTRMRGPRWQPRCSRMEENKGIRPFAEPSSMRRRRPTPSRKNTNAGCPLRFAHLAIQARVAACRRDERGNFRRLPAAEAEVAEKPRPRLPHGPPSVIRETASSGRGQLARRTGVPGRRGRMNEPSQLWWHLAKPRNRRFQEASALARASSSLRQAPSFCADQRGDLGVREAKTSGAGAPRDSAGSGAAARR